MVPSGSVHGSGWVSSPFLPYYCGLYTDSSAGTHCSLPMPHHETLYLPVTCSSGCGVVTEGLRTFSIPTCCVEVFKVFVTPRCFMWLQCIISGIVQSSQGAAPVCAGCCLCRLISLVGEDPPHLSSFVFCPSLCPSAQASLPV